MAVLIVDDDPLALMNTVLLLEDLGMETLQASSGEEALSVLGSGLPDVVVTDAMPQIVCTQLYQEIRRRFPGLPVVLATGYAELPNGRERVSGAVRLSKPVSQDQLSQAVIEATRGMNG